MTKELTEEQKIERRAKAKAWREKNKDKIREYKKRALAKPETKEKQLQYVRNWREKIKESGGNPYLSGNITPEQLKRRREVLRRGRKKYYNSEKGKRAYAKANKKLSEKIKSDPMLLKKKREEINRYHRVKRKTDPIFNLKTMVRNRLKMFLKTKKITQRNKTFDLIGCTPEELKIHIEKQFKPGMSWDNWGRNTWHIDHAVPLGAANTMEDIEMLCHYSNLQPMWATENIKKKDKF